MRSAPTFARAYIRVSHERSAEKAISPETQRRRIEAYAAEQGYIIKEWYTELAKSAFKNESARTEFRRMIADAKVDPETSVILVYRYDRFSRSWSAPAQQEELLRHGVRIESAEEGYYDPDSEVGAIMMPLTWSLNRLFSIKLRNVVIPNMKTNFEQRDPETGWAYKNGGWAQWGYKKHRIRIGRNSKSMDIHKVIWLLDDTEVAGRLVHEWAREMLLEWRLGQRMGYDAIAARLTELGIPTPSGKPGWSHTTIQSLIGDRTRLYQYAGYAYWNREDCTDRSNRRRRDESEWIIVENAHPAIITPDQAQEIYAMTEGRQKPKSGRNGEASRFALSGGLLKCAACGSNYAGIKRQAGDYYVCGSHLYRRGAGCGPSWNIPRDKIENLVLSKILKWLAVDDAALQARVDEANRAIEENWKPFEATKRERRAKMKQLEGEISNLVATAAAAGPSEAVTRALREKQAALARLKNIDAVEKPAPIGVEHLIKLRDMVQSAAISTDGHSRAKILKDFVIEILADPESKTLEGRLCDPRALVYISVAVPRGVGEYVYYPLQITRELKFTSSLCRRGFWGQGAA